MKFNKDEIKNSLTLNQIEDLLTELGGEPRRYKDLLIAKTICHGGSSHKLYYYPNTKLFRCYTDCSDTWDIFELIPVSVYALLFSLSFFIQELFGALKYLLYFLKFELFAIDELLLFNF